MEAPPRQEGLTILRRLIAYAKKLFQFSEDIVAGIVDRRLQPRLPTAGIVKAVAVLFWTRMGNLNALEQALPDHHGIGIVVLDGHESRASYRRHCPGCLERTINHVYVYDTLKRNTFLQPLCDQCFCMSNKQYRNHGRHFRFVG